MANQDKDGWETLNAFLNGSAFGGKAQTNKEAYKDGPTAFRAWIALGSPCGSFDKWLQRPAKVFPTSGGPQT